ncbi:hypothetical protein [Anaerotignum sp.]|nr:hypothetical protein [Anaerotignum sp.]
MNLSIFFTYTLLTAYKPGSNNIMSMTNGSKEGEAIFFAGICICDSLL